MNKGEFTKLIKDQIKDAPFEKQTQELYKMRDIIEQIASNIHKDQREHYIYCTKCKKFYRPSAMKKEEERSLETIQTNMCWEFYRPSAMKKEEEKSLETIQTNMCWGEWDEPQYAKAWFKITYVICPKCKTKTVYKEERL